MSGSVLRLDGGEAHRGLLDAIPVPCWIHKDGVVLYANPAFARLVRVAHAEKIAGKPTDYFLAPESRAAFADRARGLLEARDERRGEDTLVGEAGRRIDVDETSTTIQFLGEPAVLSFFQDTTEQHHKETILREGERRYRRLLEANLLGFIELDEERILAANDVFLRIVGRTRQELERGELHWQQMTPPEYRLLDAELARALHEGGECGPFEKEFYRPDGSRVLVLLGCATFTMAPDYRGICFVVDLTDRRELQEMRAEKLRSESVGMLAAGMAHNLNNLLTAIIGNASMLASEPMARYARARQTIDEIIGAGQRAAQLTAQLLAYAGRGGFVGGPANLYELLLDEAELARSTLPANVVCRLELPETLPRVIADPGQLAQVIQALLSNAVEAVAIRAQGEIVVGGRVEEVAAGTLLSRTGESMPAGQYCVIEVRDNGPGMDASTLAHAFDPFFSTKFPGRGLGLAAVAGVVRMAAGAIRVKTAPGEGCIFQVYLPAARDA